jgi:hypothetical protein
VGGEAEQEGWKEKARRRMKKERERKNIYFSSTMHTHI